MNVLRGWQNSLKKNIGEIVVVFERDGSFVFGTIKDVQDDSILILGDLSFKFICFCGSPNQFTVEKFVISICEITEFGVLLPAQRDAILNAFQNQLR